MNANELKKLLFMSVLVTGLSVNTVLKAQDFGLENVVDSEQLDIDGDFNKRREYKKKLNSIQNQTNDIVDKQLSKKRQAAEKEIQKEIQDLFNGKGGDSVHTKSSAVKKIEKKMDRDHSSSFQAGRTAIMTYAGTGVVNTENTNLNMGISTGIRGEYIVNERFAFGVGFNYSKVDMTREDNQDLLNTTNGYFYPAQQNLDYERFSLELLARMFVMRSEIVRPYFGVGIGMVYNKMSYDYDLDQDNNTSAYSNNNNYQTYNNSAYQGAQYNPSIDNYSDNNFEGILMLGTDFIFTKHFGLNIEGRFVKGFGADDERTVRPQYYELEDDSFLQNSTNSLADANYFTLTAGLIFTF